MLNTIFTTFFEAQIGEPIFMWIAKGFNCLLLFCGIERLIDFAIRKYNQMFASKEEEEPETKMRPIGFR